MHSQRELPFVHDGLLVRHRQQQAVQSAAKAPTEAKHAARPAPRLATFSSWHTNGIHPLIALLEYQPFAQGDA